MDSYSTKPTDLGTGTLLMCGKDVIGILTSGHEEEAELIVELLNRELTQAWEPREVEEWVDRARSAARRMDTRMTAMKWWIRRS